MKPINSPLNQGSKGAAVANLQDALRFMLEAKVLFEKDKADRESSLMSLAKERNQRSFGEMTAKLVKQFQKQHNLATDGRVDRPTAQLLNQVLKEMGDSNSNPKEHLIEGHVVLQDGRPAKELTLRLYRREFGGDSRLLKETPTSADGAYVFSYDPGVHPLSLEVRVVDAAEQSEREIVLTKPLNGISQQLRTVLNLTAPVKLSPLKTEYQRLSEALKSQLRSMNRLAQAREDDVQQDLTLLSQATGWDARLIALASLAEKLGADLKLSSPAVYGLLRAGLPSDKSRFVQIDPDTVETALKKARDAKIVDLTLAQVGNFKDAFSKVKSEKQLELRPPGSDKTYGELLRASGLGKESQAKFESAFFKPHGDANELWQAARQAGLNEKEVHTLKLQGKLAFLSGSNVDLMARLQQQSIKDPVELVAKNFHRADSWVEEIFKLAGIPKRRINNLNDEDRRKLDKLIPSAFAGKTSEDRLRAYTEEMARKVRASYPTHVVAHLLKTDPKFKLPKEAHDVTVELLNRAAGQGFRLGATPVNKFFETHTGITANFDKAAAQAAQTQISNLYRTYQLTPTDEAMAVLTGMGITSAYDVMCFSEERFTAAFEAAYVATYREAPPRGTSTAIWRKAEQVNSVTYNILTVSKETENGSPVAVLSPPPEVRDSVRAGVRDELDRQYATMESLFGPLDFCECDHCRSVLSPAAYFVDLLQFIDPSQTEWEGFEAVWRDAHKQLSYPHREGDKALKPFDVLMKRRPDLQHIQLTCENTQTALPYIDIVNEILEYYTAKGLLDGGAAHDTGNATTADLLAEPRNVDRQAYEKLRDEARYPLNLPFDLPLETVRQFCDYFETPLWRVLDVFRTSDELFEAAKIDRSKVFFERLSLSPVEIEIYCNSALNAWLELYGCVSAADDSTETIDSGTQQAIDLNSAKVLSRRLGVTYVELAKIVDTAFVNSALHASVVQQRLGTSIENTRLFLDNRELLAAGGNQNAEQRTLAVEVGAFKAELDKLAADFSVSYADLVADLERLQFDEILHLDYTAGCEFDHTFLRYVKEDEHGKRDAQGFDFLRINLFVRLWRKLGWTIEETDRALTTLLPKNAQFDAGNLTKQPLRTALIYLSHLKSLHEKLKLGKGGPTKLLTLWSDLATTGKNSLYEQLFLTISVLKSDQAFEYKVGGYLSDANVKVTDHVATLQGALGLTAGDIDQILSEAAPQDKTELSLANVSHLYRYGLLARGLKLSVKELIALKRLSGLDPFKRLHEETLRDRPAGEKPPTKPLEFDYPFTQTLRFVEVAEEVAASGITIEDLDYLLCHRFDETGKYRQDRDSLLRLLKTLGDGVRSVRADHALPEAGSMTEELLKQKLGLILAPEVVDLFLAMLKNTAEFTAIIPDVSEADQMDAQKFAGDPQVREVSYDKLRTQQKLTLRGVLVEAQKPALRVKLGLKSRLTAAQIEKAIEDVLAQARLFFDTHLKKQTVGANDWTGFLHKHDFSPPVKSDTSGLFGPLKVIEEIKPEDEYDEVARKTTVNETGYSVELQARRDRVAQAFLPFLQERLIRQFIVQTMTAYTGADPKLVETFVTDETVLQQPGALIANLANTAATGVDASLFGTGKPVPVKSAIVPDADTGLKIEDEGPFEIHNARFEGYLEVPSSGAYRFYAVLKKNNARAELNFTHMKTPAMKGVAGKPGVEINGEVVNLLAGVPYQYRLDLRTLDNGSGRLLVQGETLPKGPVSQLRLYPNSAITLAERAVILLTKALQLVQSLGLSEREVRYLAANSADFEDFGLSQLPVGAVEDIPETRVEATSRFNRFLRVAGYARIKRDLAPGTDDLIEIFEAQQRQDSNVGPPPGVEKVETVNSLIAKLTRREEATIEATSKALSLRAFRNEKSLQRLWEGLQVVEKFGVAAASLVKWTTIVNAGAASTRGDIDVEPFGIARDLRETIKARFDQDGWRRVAQPILDRLRRRQRDALSAYIMHRRGFDSLEKLYEYFLIDPGMEPVVQTSRIRLAIASVQLFIQRCLLNLEEQVPPSAIKSKEWEWMKRYRVWEANRKIFLFPENWLEPEFRDDKTHLFAELEGALLQGDVSSDLVEDAFLTYLRKLDELARLDIVAMHIEDRWDPNPLTLHVIGRTFSQPHKYFYRRFAHHMWTPWEPVGVEIEGDHLAPVVWRDRLYCFWVTFMDRSKVPDETSPTQPGDPEPETVGEMTLSDTVTQLKRMGRNKDVAVTLHWSEYLNGQWSAPETGSISPLNTVRLDFDLTKVRIHVSKPIEGGPLYINVDSDVSEFGCAFLLVGRNSQPERSNPWFAPENRYSSSANNFAATRYAGKDSLVVTYYPRTTTEGGTSPQHADLTILEKCGAYTLTPCNHDLTKTGAGYLPDEPFVLMKPVFFQDNKYTLFVEPNITVRTIEEYGWSPLPSSLDLSTSLVTAQLVAQSTGQFNQVLLTDPASPAESMFARETETDWLTNPYTFLSFNGHSIGPMGKVPLEITPDFTPMKKTQVDVNGKMLLANITRRSL